ncbi:hypothetical protein BDZ97DRAFT_1757437 [Flammula alnicola]|nr:hypothetical protein BDZ97DRAFT_1757437 [Flammula alnicola]
MYDMPSSSAASSPTASVASLSLASPPRTPTTLVASPLAGPLPPPPLHPPMGSYSVHCHEPPLTDWPTHPNYHVFFARRCYDAPSTANWPSTLNGHAIHHDAGPSAALLDKVKALDSLPRLGALRTRDLKGNDLRTGISYLAQVLKRNRTLKVLNLSENKLDVQCLVVIAEALSKNSSLIEIQVKPRNA